MQDILSWRGCILYAYDGGVTELEETLHERIRQLEEELADTQRKLDLLVRQIFGRKSEQTPAPIHGQDELSLVMEDAAIQQIPAAPPAKPKGGSQKGRRIRAALLPEHLPVEEIVIVPLEVQASPDLWRRIGEHVM